MPQIANQDYNIVAPQYADCITVDAAAMGVLVGHLKRGTIFDVLVEKYYDPNDTTSRIINAYIRADGQGGIRAWSDAEGEFPLLVFLYTQTQYEGLAAVQEACGIHDSLPVFEVTGSSYLSETESGNILCVDGKMLSVGGTGEIESLEMTNLDPIPGFDSKDISWEDAQKLIGLPLD